MLNDIINDKFIVDYNSLEKTNVPENFSSREFIGLVFKNIWDKNVNFLTVNPDISSSTKIACSNSKQNIQVGVREFIAAAIVNGIVAHKGSRAVFSSFLTFVDYCKASLRIAALSSLPALGIFTHDSILVGEDGPSHQPIEQIPTLRFIPNYYVFRPCNIKEAIASFKWYFENNKPVAIIGSRGNFKQIYNNTATYDDINKGAYILVEENECDLIIISSGSEVSLSYDVINLLKEKNIKCKLISCPCVELLHIQGKEYKEKIFNKNIPIVSIELTVPYPWYEFVDYAIGIDTFGASGKADDIVKNLGYDAYSVCDKIINFLDNNKK